MSGPHKHNQAKFYDEQLRRLTTSANKQWQGFPVFARTDTGINITPHNNLNPQLNRFDIQSHNPQLNMRLQHFRQQSSLNIEPLEHLTGEILPISMAAPLNMANLAQLSGTSLIPVMNSSVQRHQQQIIPSGNIHALGHPPQSQCLSNLTTPKNVTVNNPLISISARQPSVLNVAPSIQLISQQAHASQRSNNLDDSGYDSARAKPSARSTLKKSRDNIASNSMHSYNRRSPAYQTMPSVAISNLNSTNRSQLISNSSLELVPNLSTYHQEDTRDDIEPSEVSLMRIMAILNNPAMSITPVGATLSAINPNTLDVPVSNINHLADEFDNHDKLRNQSRLSFTSITQSNLPRTKPTSSSKNTAIRLPKSAANLLAANNAVQDVKFIKQESQSTEVREANLDIERSSDQLAPSDWISNLSTYKGDDKSVTLSWLPNAPTAPKKPTADSRQQVPESFTANDPLQGSSQTISVQMLHKLASQAEDTNNLQSCNDSFLDKDLIIEPRSVPITPRFNVKQLDKGARGQEIDYSVFVDESAVVKLKTKQPSKSSKRQLYIPSHDYRSKKPRKTLDNLNPIHIEAIEQREVLISERHLMLERMVEIAETVGQRNQAPVEPDDIFVNRSKRIMSRIDTVLEKKKRRRFELICDRTSPKDVVDSDEDDDGSMIDDSARLFESIVVPIQLPLEEPVTDEKRNYLSKVGLISRNDRNKLSIEQCESRLRSLSALALEDLDEVSEDIQRFVETVNQTGGTEIQFRTETNIKRNELPFIEGLNRNTSRIKMNFMATLGLDKRSKRTTLYKVTKPQETTQSPSKQKQQSDLIESQQLQQQYQQQSRKLANSVPVGGGTQTMHQSSRQDRKIGNNNQLRIEAANLIAKAVEFAQANCRKAMQVPKDEYMKSLGLTAS